LKYWGKSDKIKKIIIFKGGYVMSGHSKFANIKHRKERNDSARGKVFTRLGRELTVAVKTGGADPSMNAKLKDIIVKAKSNNMPNDTIDRAIKKAAGEDSSIVYEAITYEGYGPNGLAIIVEALTDNRNRAAANIRNAFTKGGGSVGTPGCVSFMFEEKGQIMIENEDGKLDADEIMMIALDAGAEDFSIEEEGFEVLTAPHDFSKVRQALEDAKIHMVSAEVTRIPQVWVELTNENDVKKLNKILDLLDEEDDVQNVYNNWDEPDEE